MRAGSGPGDCRVGLFERVGIEGEAINFDAQASEGASDIPIIVSCQASGPIAQNQSQRDRPWVNCQLW